MNTSRGLRDLATAQHPDKPATKKTPFDREVSRTPTESAVRRFTFARAMIMCTCGVCE
jgi:hypothetical protein